MTCRKHPRRDLAGHQEVTGEVGLDDSPEALGRHLPETKRLGQKARVNRAHPDAGVVDQHVDAAQPRPRFLDRPGHRRFVLHVKADPHPTGQLRGDLGCTRPDRPVSATLAPAPARAAAIAWPSPLVPPVTSTFTAPPAIPRRYWAALKHS